MNKVTPITKPKAKIEIAANDEIIVLTKIQGNDEWVFPMTPNEVDEVIDLLIEQGQPWGGAG